MATLRYFEDNTSEALHSNQNNQSKEIREKDNEIVFPS